MDELRISISEAGGDATVSVAGELDLATADALWIALEPLVGSGATVVLECAELTFMDSTGMRVLLRAARRARDAGGSFAVRGMLPDIQRVLDLAGVTAEIAQG